MTDTHDFIQQVITDTGRKGWNWLGMPKEWCWSIATHRANQYFTDATAADVITMELWREVQEVEPHASVAFWMKSLEGRPAYHVFNRPGSTDCMTNGRSGATPLAAMHAAWMKVCGPRVEPFTGYDRERKQHNEDRLNVAEQTITMLERRIAALEAMAKESSVLDVEIEA